MEYDKSPVPQTAGQYLEAGRRAASLSVRQLADLAGMPKSTVDRILRDEVQAPSAEQLQQLASVLEVDPSEVLAFIGVTPPEGLPPVAPYLRAKYKLQGDALREATEQLQQIIEKHSN